MYRGSRLAASFLLVLTGSAVTAFGLGVLPEAIGTDGPWILVPLVVAFGIAHFVALVGIARARTWGRELAVSIAEAGGGIAIAGLSAIMLGANPFSVGAGLLAWNVAMLRAARAERRTDHLGRLASSVQLVAGSAPSRGCCLKAVRPETARRPRLAG